jgi:parallel beta-helix repeat protein
VAAAADLRAVMAAVTTPATFCLAAGTYELGANSLHFDSGDVIVGQPVTFGPNGEVTAPTAIHGTATTGVIEAQTGDADLTLDSLDICCATLNPNDSQSGVGVNAGNSKLVNLTVRNSRIHGNASRGIGNGPGPGLNVDHSEFDHNGSGNGGTDAGIKTVNYAVITNSYIHDNNPQGMWWDCDAPGGIVENSTVEANARAGVMVEISSGNATSPHPLPPWGSYGFTIRNNHVEGNNTSNTAPYAGIYVTSSMNVNVDGNTVINNTGQNIRVQNDSRAGQGHDGCSSGFFSANDVAQNNQYGPLDITDCTLAGVTCTNSTKIL